MLGATAMHSKKEPDTEEGGRRGELGSRWHIQDSEGLGVGTAQAARTPGGPGGRCSGAALTLSTPPPRQACGVGTGGGEAWARHICKLPTAALALWATICLGLQSSSSC